MKIAIVIPAHNEEQYIAKCLDSLCKQSYLPTEIIVVDDNSTDATSSLVEEFSIKHDFIKLVSRTSSTKHTPGSKIIKAFYHGFELLTTDFDIICKFDADLIFPNNYLLELNNAFKKQDNLGMFAGFCYIQNSKGNWIKEQLSNDDHLRGPLKAYRKECFEAIGGLKKEMGWDTLDELLARFYGWKTQTDQNLKVKHLKPTGKLYSHSLAKRYGKALYKMDYRFWLSFLSLLKIAFLKNQIGFFFQGISSYLKASIFQKTEKIVTSSEGRFIRNYRWKMIKKKFFKS